MRVLFEQVGRVVQSRIFYDWVGHFVILYDAHLYHVFQGSFSVFAFLEFSEHREAVRAMAFNGRILFNRVGDSVLHLSWRNLAPSLGYEGTPDVHIRPSREN